MTAADLPLLTDWLREPAVARWWNHQTTPEAIERDFGPSVRGEEAGEDLVVSLAGRKVGLVQRSLISDYPEDLEEFVEVVDVPAGAVELDYLIGEAAQRGRGLGSRMIAAIVEDTWSAYPAAAAVLVAVVAANVPSWRALEKAGLQRIAEGAMSTDNPIDDPLHFIYRVDRPPALPAHPALLAHPADHPVIDVVVVVDVANVMGSRPDGWWRDRHTAAAGLLTAFDALPGLVTIGPDGMHLRIERVVAVLEGAARGATAAGRVEVVEAERDGDTTIVAVTEELSASRPASPSGNDERPGVLVVTADRGLRQRLPGTVHIAGPQWLNELIGR